MDGKKSKASISNRQRKAAYKAQKTMRYDRWSRGAENMENIKKFMTLQQVSKLAHPEIEKPETRYAKGIISLFHKTPADIACGRFWEAEMGPMAARLTAATVTFVER